MGSLGRPSFGSRIQEREEETCICAPVVIGKSSYNNKVLDTLGDMDKKIFIHFYRRKMHNVYEIYLQLIDFFFS